MKKTFSLLIYLIASKSNAFSQDIPVRTLPTEVFRSVKKDANDTAKWTWKRGGLLSMNLSQGSLSNWAAGGENFSMAVTSYVNYFLLHKKKNYTWDNSLDFNLGFVQATSLGSRKNDDRLDILSKFGYRVDTTNKIYATALFNFRTQFFDGYTYAGDVATLSSTFLSPAYVLLSVGFDYKPYKNLSIFLSPLTSRLTALASKRLYEKGLYGIPAGKKAINELGAFSSINYTQNIGKTITYKGRIDLFSNYNNHPQNVDVYMTNLVSFKINKLLSATYNLDLIYDDDVKLFGPDKNSPALQVKSLIGIGFLMKLNNVVN